MTNAGTGRYGSLQSPVRGGIETGEETTLRNTLMGLAQRREQDSFRFEVDRILSLYRTRPHILDRMLVLHFVVWTNDNNDLAQVLLDIGCNPFAADFNGDTALHYAVRGGNLRLLVYLFDRLGEEIFNVINIHHCNLLLTAAAEASDERTYEILHLLEWLWFRGFSLETQDNQGKTALLWAAQRNSLVICQWLLSRGANLNHRDHMNRTALHMACSAGNADLVLFLCDRGAIRLTDAQSNDDDRINTPSRICWQRGLLWLSLSLKRWKLFQQITGKCTFLSNQYSWNALWLTLWNLLCGSMMCVKLDELKSSRSRELEILFYPTMMGVLIFWVMATKKDPGYVKSREEVIGSQIEECDSKIGKGELLRCVEKRMKKVGRGEALRSLSKLESEMLEVSVALGGLNKMKRRIMNRGVSSSRSAKIDEDINRNVMRLSKLSHEITQLRPQISKERIRNGCPIYAEVVATGRMITKRVCFTCHHIRPFRSHHCAECSACIRRFDHHCVWIDNCVGLHNQRAFLFFLITLTTAILVWFALVATYVTETILNNNHPSQTIPSTNLLKLLTSITFYAIVITSFGNLVWICFVGFLLLRTGKSMITDLTFYEYLKPGPHVVKRFGSVSKNSCLWDVQDLNISSIFQNIWHFCAQSHERDFVTYPWAERNIGHSLLQSHHDHQSDWTR